MYSRKYLFMFYFECFSILLCVLLLVQYSPYYTAHPVLNSQLPCIGINLVVRASMKTSQNSQI